MNWKIILAIVLLIVTVALILGRSNGSTSAPPRVDDQGLYIR